MHDSNERRRLSINPHSLALVALVAALGCGDDGGGVNDTDDGGTTLSSATDASTDAGPSTTASSADETSGDDTTGGEPSALDPEAIARIHAAVEQSLGNGFATGYSVAIWRDGEVIYAEGFGVKDEAGNAVTPDTLFQVGSDTKKMAAINVLQLVDAGLLSLDQTVSELLPELDLVQSPGHFDTVTVHDLLSHQSGLWDYTPWIDDPDDGALAEVAYGRFAENEYAMMPAGIAWNYCNPNYSLAGLLVEELDGRSWPEVVIDDLATPLGMTQTFARRDDALAATTDIASGYGFIYPNGLDSFDVLEAGSLMPDPPGWTAPADQADHAFTRPAGFVWSTASDMTRLAGFLIEGDPQVLSEASRAALMNPHVATIPGVEPSDMGYGYGVFMQRGLAGPEGRFYDVPVVSHGGNTLSMSSAFVLLPEQDVAISILSNGESEDTSLLQAVALEVAAIERLPAPSEPHVPVQPPRDDLSGYAGTFQEHAIGEVTLTFDGTDLLIDIPALEAFGIPVEPALTPIARDVFLLTIGGGELDLSFYDGQAQLEFGVNRNFVLARAMSLVMPPSRDLVATWVRRATQRAPLTAPRSFPYRR